MAGGSTASSSLETTPLPLAYTTTPVPSPTGEDGIRHQDVGYQLSDTVQAKVTWPQDGRSIGSAPQNHPAKLWGTKGTDSSKQDRDVKRFLKQELPPPTLSGRARKAIVDANKRASRKSAVKWATGFSAATGVVTGIAGGAAIGTAIFPGIGTGIGAVIGGLATFMGTETITGLLGLWIGGKLGKARGEMEIAWQERNLQQDRIKKLDDFRRSHPSPNPVSGICHADDEVVDGIVAKVGKLRNRYLLYDNVAPSEREQIAQATNDALELVHDLKARRDIPVDDLVAKHEHKAARACDQLFRELLPSNDYGERKTVTSRDLARLLANAHRLSNQAYWIAREGVERSTALSQDLPSRPELKSFEDYFKHQLSQAFQRHRWDPSDRRRDELCMELMYPGDTFRELYAASSSFDDKLLGAQNAIRTAMRHTISTISNDDANKNLAMKLLSEQIKDSRQHKSYEPYSDRFDKALIPGIDDYDRLLLARGHVAAQEGPLMAADAVLRIAEGK